MIKRNVSPTETDNYPSKKTKAVTEKYPNKKTKTLPQANSTTQTFLSGWVKPSPANDASFEEKNSKQPGSNFETLTKGLDGNKKELLRLEAETLDGEWLRALNAELKKPYFLQLKNFLKSEKESKKTVFPPERDIYSWSRFTPLSNVKVVIVGQGLCFSVKNGVRCPPSLLNIYKALKLDIPSFEIPNHGNLENWAKEGVLLLNASLTVRAHDAASHSGKGWEKFTDAVIQYLNEKKNSIVFLLWGSHAQKKGKNIDKSKHLVLTAAHPSPLSAHHGFFECRHWSKANEFLKSRGRAPINWNCLANPQIHTLTTSTTTPTIDTGVSTTPTNAITRAVNAISEPEVQKSEAAANEVSEFEVQKGKTATNETSEFEVQKSEAAANEAPELEVQDKIAINEASALEAQKSETATNEASAIEDKKSE
ncbi:9674_t:CDS:2 [Ambispora leptoticha]|uniref:Uracil-DNA glycosylase n=1 Tax=Ambispora leptoticha TaxID=144679 RepID=A0A9N8W3N4_9GLOM|nr:9674_t:CDS:2 [Ambispora leptoticha]